MTDSVVERLLDAINSHDLEKLTACFSPDFSVTWPAHPVCPSHGHDGVRRNWDMVFRSYPGITATMSTRAKNGNHVWGEWEFRGENPDRGPGFWQRGVIIVVVEGDAIVESRFYMEPVEAAAGV